MFWSNFMLRGKSNLLPLQIALLTSVFGADIAKHFQLPTTS